MAELPKDEPTVDSAFLFAQSNSWREVRQMDKSEPTRTFETKRQCLQIHGRNLNL